MDTYLPHITDTLNQLLGSIACIYPEIALSAAFLLVIAADLFLPRRLKDLVFALTLAGLIISGCLAVQQLSFELKRPVFSGMVWPGRFSGYFKLIIIAAAILCVLFIKDNRQIKEHKKGRGDLCAVLLAAVLGLNLMVMSANLLMVYLSVEMVSVGSYLMVGYLSANNRQAEAAIKYALFGAVCSAVMLYGMSLLYAFTGTLNLFDPAFITGLNHAAVPAAGVALTMVLAGIGFKLSFFPLHFWSPDVYEGAPTPVTAFLSTGPKIAGFGLLKLFLSAFTVPAGTAYLLFDFRTVLVLIAIATMIVGNFAAIWQNNMKRMLAYSSIGHTGFLLMAVTTSYTDSGSQALLFYLFVYALMTIAGFMLADRVEEQTGAINISDYKGLGRRLPLTFFLFVVVLVSLTGLPPTAGFIGKLLVFSAALKEYGSTGSVLLLVLMATGAVTTLVSLYYYFKVPLNAWLRTADAQTHTDIPLKKDFRFYACILIALLLIVLGIFPQLLIGLLS